MKAELIKGKVDFAIISIREDEWLAVLQRFPNTGDVLGRRTYSLTRLGLPPSVNDYIVVTARTLGRGEAAAQDLARDMIEDLDPQWLVLIGICGGIGPSDEYTLGDVVLATKLTDFSVSAAEEGGRTEYAVSGGPMHKLVEDLLAYLQVRLPRLGDWNSPESITARRPSVDITPLTLSKDLYGPQEWQDKVRQSLTHHFDPERAQRRPLVATGAIGSSDLLLKDTRMAAAWKDFARDILVVEMELAGVYKAARRMSVAQGTSTEYPILAVRGVSDVVGYRRAGPWTTYACHTAAAFAYALLRTRPIEPCSTRRVAEALRESVIKRLF